MANLKPEQDLIDLFVDALRLSTDLEICLDTLYNKNCKSKTYADIEYKSRSGVHWVIEAKSNVSSDAHNTVHKIFGELLKETGRTSRNCFKHAVLIPENSKKFYSRLFQSINREKFIGFGKLIPIDTVFTFGSSGIIQISWVELYDFFY